MTKTTKEIVLLGHSDIGDRMAEMKHGTFETVGAAEVFARKNIRSVRWCVGNRITRVRENGDVEVDHEYLTNVYNPRKYED